MFSTGQKVVCIDDKFSPWVHDLYVALPTKGETYTVRDIAPGQDIHQNPEVVLTLREFHNPCGEGGLERGFIADRFRVADPVRAEEEIEEVISTPLVPSMA